MSLWTMDQIGQARGLRAEAQISPEAIDRASFDMLGEVRRELAAAISTHAHPFAIEIHPQDLRFREVPGDKEWKPVAIRCWWEPMTLEVELAGGEKDGEILEFRDAPHGPLMVAVSVSGNPFAGSNDISPVGPAGLVQRYECSGWREVKRRWVYSAT